MIFLLKFIAKINLNLTTIVESQDKLSRFLLSNFYQQADPQHKINKNYQLFTLSAYIKEFKFINWNLYLMPDYSYEDERTPAQCRNGPIQQRSCTDCFCCVLYLLLIAATIFFAIFFSGINTMTGQQINAELKDSQIGNPILAIFKGKIPILLTLGGIAAMCLILTLTTFLIPAIVGFIYVPLFLILMLLAGAVFLIRYFGKTVPLVSPQIQKDFAAEQNIVTLIIGLVFLVGFLAAVITICSKRSKFKNIVPVLRIAKSFFWHNPYVLLYSIFFTILSIVVLTANIFLLDLSQASKQDKISKWIPAGIIAVEILWTHGFMEALSDFFFESVAIHWYFKERRIQNNEETCCSSLCLTNNMICRHIGTIVYGHILAYIPETLNTMLGRCQKNCGCCYNSLCLVHRCIFRQMTKYGYIETILQSLPFCAANKQMFGLRKRTKSMLPDLYMMGNFYITLAKIFVVMLSIVVGYVLVSQMQAQIMEHPINIAGPLIFIFLAALQISNHFMNLTGLVGDTLVFMYTVDLQIQKKNYGEMQPHSCPEKILQIINDIRVAQAVYDS